jgi:chaperone BCS1
MHDFFQSLGAQPFFSGGLTLMVVGYIAAVLRHVPHKLVGLVRRRMAITVEIQDRDEGFTWARDWLAKNNSLRRARDLVAETTYIERSQGPMAVSPGNLTLRKRFVFSPAEGLHLIRFNGHLVSLSRTKRDTNIMGTSVPSWSYTFRFFTGGRALVDAMFEEIGREGMPKEDGIRIKTASYQSWTAGELQAKRPVESVFLADGVMESLLDDVDGFLASREFYASRGIPYRRGYLLYGPPGTGKTTTVAAIAGKIGLDVCVLNLADRTMDDNKLSALVSSLPQKSILLIEDIDCVFKDEAERETKDGVPLTMSGLLNAIDGIQATDGRVLFMTTNHPERLDKALMRPGRIDRQVALDVATSEQLGRMFLWFYRDAKVSPSLLSGYAAGFVDGAIRGCSMAQAQQLMLRHRDDPAAFAWAASEHLAAA